MERVHSVGVATIASLMGRGRTHASGAAASDSREPQSVAAPGPGWTGRNSARASDLDLSEIGRRCEREVVTAYRELRALGVNNGPAFAVCTALYRVHHPEAMPGDARQLVAAWIEHHVMRGACGPTQGCDCD